MRKSLWLILLLAAGAVYAAPAQSTGAMFEALGIPKDRVREAWNTPELKLRAGQWHDAKLRFESGNIGIYEVWNRELAALRALMSQPEVAASPLMPELIRAYSKRLKQQLDMLKAEYESGFRGLEPVRKKELEIAEFRKRHGLPEMPPPEREKASRVAPPSFTDGVRTWESLISQKGCLVSATDVGFTTEGSIFAAPEWREFFDKAKRNGILFRFIVDKFSSERPTEIHICNFRNATEGELAVFVVQRIVNRNWYAYDGGDDELKRIAGQDAAAKVQLLKPALKNDRTRAALQNYFVREYERMVGATVAPSPVGKWALFAYERTGKSRMPTSLTVFADGRYESRTSKGTTVEIVRGTWRQDGADVYFTDSDKEFRNRFDNTGRLVPDGQEELHKNGCELFFERETGK